ncbi:MAG: hypothetical protein KatS3mg108_3270 [Isosphaeraceae bacterium]|nr:MAG: hypothetical protein KatS3mg108_3270 [Isosphaeraceae bacterium]
MFRTLGTLIWLATGATTPETPTLPPPPYPAPATCTAGHPVHHHHHGLCIGHGQITPPGPGFGWGFPNGAADGYGWWDPGTTLPLGPNRTSELYFRRKFALPAAQCFFPSYYNPYITRGQRYLPFAGDGGDHPAGGAPTGSARLSLTPYQDFLRSRGPEVAVPRFSGRAEAEPIPSGTSGLLP